MGTRLPLDLYAEIETADGTRYRWDANQAPGSRLRNFSFRTKIGEGFADANGQLARRIDLDYPDLGLVNTVTLTGADGSVAYEGRLSAMPRDLSDTHSIGVTLAGWMAHTKDRKFVEVYVDNDLARLQSTPFTRRVASPTVAIDQDYSWNVAGGTLIFNGVDGKAISNDSLTEAWYAMPRDCVVHKVQYQGTHNNTTNINAPALLTDDDDAGGSPSSVAMTLDDTLRTVTVTTPERYAFIQARASATHTPAAGAPYSRTFSKLAFYGEHNLTLRENDGNPYGFYASDVMRDIVSRWCPQLDISGIQDTSYVIGQLAFVDRTFPYDAFLELNKYHLWHLGVWEEKRLDFRPYDLTDYDWEIRTDDAGTTFSPQGPSTESLFNGITVQYQDILTGATNVLTPDTNPELADTSSTNPWNQHGIAHWDEIQLSTPDTESGAAFLGAAALADRNTPKTPGTITVRGYIRDRAGNDQPAWKPRAGDTISITNFPNDSPRLIVETDYSDEDKTLRIAVDRPFQLLDAYLDRVGTALGARGLG